MTSVRVGAVLVLLLGNGCANPVNQVTWGRYTEGGNQAHNRGDLAGAEEAHRRALINARIGHLGSEREATSLHNLALVKRDLCKLDEAREAWQMAFDLRDKNPNVPSTFLAGTTFELAQLSYEQGRYADAVKLMERGFPLVEKIDIASAEPEAYAHLLREYADALRKINRAADADAVQARLDTLVSQRGIDLTKKSNRPPFNHPAC